MKFIQLVCEIIDKFDGHQLPAFQLRPKVVARDTAFDGDFDILYQPNYFADIISFIHSRCANEGVHFVVDQKPINKKIIFIFSPGLEKYVTLEFWPYCELQVKSGHKWLRNRLTFKSIEHLLYGKENGNSDNFVLFKSLIYLTHIHYKKKDLFHNEVQYRLRYFQDNLDEAAGTRTQIFLEARHIYRDIINCTLDTENANIQALILLKKMGIKPLSKAEDFFYRGTKKIARTFRWKTAQVIPLVGPDGVGKGTIQRLLLESDNLNRQILFKSLFRVYPFYQVMQRLIPSSRHVSTNQRDERMVIFVLLMAFINFSLKQITRRSIVLMDRYFPDYYTTPLRLPKQEPQRIKCYRLVMQLTPVPDKQVVLGCQFESLCARKNELSLKAVKSLNSVYFDFIATREVPETIFVSTENSPEDCAQFLRKALRTI